jgi:hypothetical protein
MSSELSRLICDNNGTFWDHAVNHQQCFCHVLALILGAGLTAIKLLTDEGPTPRKPELFPTLETITKEGELLEDDPASDDEEEIDPDDLSKCDAESNGNSNSSETIKTKGKYAESGIGFTLKKVSYCFAFHLSSLTLLSCISFLITHLNVLSGL